MGSMIDDLRAAKAARAKLLADVKAVATAAEVKVEEVEENFDPIRNIEVFESKRNLFQASW